MVVQVRSAGGDGVMALVASPNHFAKLTLRDAAAGAKGSAFVIAGGPSLRVIAPAPDPRGCKGLLAKAVK